MVSGDGETSLLVMGSRRPSCLGSSRHWTASSWPTDGAVSEAHARAGSVLVSVASRVVCANGSVVVDVPFQRIERSAAGGVAGRGRADRLRRPGSGRPAAAPASDSGAAGSIVSAICPLPRQAHGLAGQAVDRCAVDLTGPARRGAALALVHPERRFTVIRGGEVVAEISESDQVSTAAEPILFGSKVSSEWADLLEKRANRASWWIIVGR